jgi:hypothetical protein
MWKLTKYNWPLLLECLWYLHKWDKVIRKQAYASWKHNLDSAHANKTTTDLSATSLSPQQLHTFSKHIDVIVRHYPKELNCMRRSLALKSIIERRSGKCKLHIGVKLELTEPSTVSSENAQTKKNENKPKTPTMAAHAWITVNTFIVNDTPEKIAEYQEITRNNTLFSNANINK